MSFQQSGKPSIAQALAAAGTLGSLLAVTVLPALQEPVVFSSSVALEWMGLVALIWATAFLRPPSDGPETSLLSWVS